MARGALDHLADMLEAFARIREYTRGGEAAFHRSAMVRDAIIARLIQIGQAVKDAQDEDLDLPVLAPQVPWRDIAGMRDRLAHKYWDADPALLWQVVESDLDAVEKAVRSIMKKQRSLTPKARKARARKARGAKRR
ncbi:MAG: HepT-like ribonuclease domain-containing protein [Burkholderiales bacterium]|nr:HepT-like ribonuclease domain-containing protein [Burkholderiales bacterium]